MQNLKIDNVPATLSVNFEEVKKALEEHVAKYDIVVTAETVGEAKKLATELNKQANDIDRKRKDAVAVVSEPIKAFEGKMKELVALCKDGRQKILDQVENFENETRELAEALLVALRGALWDEYAVEEEFRKAEYDDLIKLTSVTDTGNLAKSAKDEMEKRTREDKALQDNVKMRLLQLENESYKVGLSAPLQRAHVEHFLFDDDETYNQKLESLIETEMIRQEIGEERRRVKKAREAQRAAETQEKLNEQPAPPPAEKGKVGYTVTCVFHIEVGPDVTTDAIEAEARKKMRDAGITTLASVAVTKNQ